MKIKYLLFFLAPFVMTACGDDDTSSSDNVLNYDGANQSAPALDPGNHELAVYFPASMTSQHIGKKLTEVEFYAGNAPQLCSLRIHGPGTSTSPGSEIYGANVTNLVQGSPRWITHILSDPIEITGEDLWIGLFVTHNATIQSIGCDAGPRKEGGDWIWQSADPEWQTFLASTGTESVNWNIRGILEE